MFLITMKLMLTKDERIAIIVTAVVLAYTLITLFFSVAFGLLTRAGYTFAKFPAWLFKRISVVDNVMPLLCGPKCRYWWAFDDQKCWWELNEHEHWWRYGGNAQITNLSNSLSTNTYPNLPPRPTKGGLMGGRVSTKKYDMSFSDKMNF